MQFDEWVNEHKILVFSLVGVSLLLLVLALAFTLRPKNDHNKTTLVTVISLNDGNNEVIVDRNGQVTIKTPFGTFTQYWDKEKIRQFFDNLDDLDFDTLSQYIGTDLAISLTASDGRQIIIDDSQLPQLVLDLLQTTLEQTYEEEQLEIIKPSIVLNTPKPPVYKTTATPIVINNNPWHQGIEPENIQPFSCEAYAVSGERRVIVSQTLCGQ